MTKEFTAKDMHHAPAQVYRAADKEGKAYIRHKHYPDRVFTLTAMDIEDYTFQIMANSFTTEVKKIYAEGESLINVKEGKQGGE